MAARSPGFGAALRGALADRQTRGRWATVVVVALVLAVATGWFLRGHDQRGLPTDRPYADAPYYYAYLPSLVLDHDLDFTDEYQVTHNWYRLGKTPTGKPGNVFGVGPALLSLPAFAIGHAVAVATDQRRDGFSDAELTAVMWMSVLLSVLALVFPARVIARRFGRGPVGLWAALAVAAGGPVVYYAVRQPGYAHPYATFFAAWLIDAWDASYERPRTARTWAGLGLLLGLATLARPQLATWGVLLAAAAVDDVRQRRPVARALARWAGAAALIAACLAPQLATWRALYGSWYVVPQGDGFMRWDAPAWSETLFAARNGLLPWAPIYGVGALGLILALARRARLAGLLLGGVLLQAMVNGAAWDWWGGGSFGGRRFDSCYPAFAIGLGAVLVVPWALARRARRFPRLAGGAAGVVTAALVAGTLALAAANVVVAVRVDSTTARIYGGEPPAEVLRAHLHRRGTRPLGAVAATAARWVAWPARAAFAWRHDAAPDAYDRVVGVHFLGETYPGLNATPPATEERRAGVTLGPAFRTGLRSTAREPGALEQPGWSARLLVPLNLRGPVTVALALRHPAGGRVDLRWNDRWVATAALTATVATVEFTTTDVRRGVNQLAWIAPPGLLLDSLTLRAAPSPRR
ncbi:MAG: hypothetical protein R3B06_19360 [Kofleriaceae bacterium]